MEPFNNTPLAKVNRLYSDYRGAGFDKSTILRKLKAQFSGAKFSFKGATLYVAFGDNPAQKVTGGVTETEAAARLSASTEIKAAKYSGFPWYVWHKETKYVVAGFVEPNDALKFAQSKSAYQAIPASTVQAYHG